MPGFIYSRSIKSGELRKDRTFEAAMLTPGISGGAKRRPLHAVVGRPCYPRSLLQEHHVLRKPHVHIVQAIDLSSFPKVQPRLPDRRTDR